MVADGVFEEFVLKVVLGEWCLSAAIGLFVRWPDRSVFAAGFLDFHCPPCLTDVCGYAQMSSVRIRPPALLGPDDSLSPVVMVHLHSGFVLALRLRRSPTPEIRLPFSVLSESIESRSILPCHTLPYLLVMLLWGGVSLEAACCNRPSGP